MARSEQEGEIDSQIARGFFQAIFHRDSIAWLCGGVLVFIIGAAGEVPYVRFELGQSAAICGMIVGVAVLAWGGYLALLGTRRRLNDDRVSIINELKHRVTVIKPEPKIRNRGVPVPVTLEARLHKEVPQGIELWVFTIVGTSYFPQASLHPRKGVMNYRWSGIYDPGKISNGGERELQLFFVGPNGRALIKCYHHLNEKFAVPDNKPWGGIQNPTDTDDIIEATEVFPIKLLASAQPAVILN